MAVVMLDGERLRIFQVGEMPDWLLEYDGKAVDSRVLDFLTEPPVYDSDTGGPVDVLVRLKGPQIVIID